MSMKFKKFLSILFIVLLVTTAFSQIAQAKSKQSLVALGDSITFGWNLSPGNLSPSKLAYPSLIAQVEHYQVNNLSIPGATSSDLLSLLKTPSYRDAVSHASLITLNIGSNDFLEGASSIIQRLSSANFQLTQEDMLLLASITTQLGLNLAAIIQEIRSLTNVPIILYNIYNPFYGFDLQAGAMLFNANQMINAYGNYPGIEIADAFSAFAGKQIRLILPNDVHPNVLGQIVLAYIGLKAMNSLETQNNAMIAR
jgi:lysophospholipase L1-like esterase